MWNGVISRAELEQAGLNGHRIAGLQAKGELVHVSRGWYAQKDASPLIKLVAMCHTRLGCLSACQFHDLWVPPEKDRTIHLVANSWESAGKIAGKIHNVTNGRIQPVIHREYGIKTELVVDVKWAVEQVARFHRPEEALVVIESALNLGKMSVSDVECMLKTIPKSRARCLRKFQTTSQSGSETRVAHFLRGRGLKVVQQFSPIPGWFVDMLVGNSWILECDSAAHHAGKEAFARDRQRDLLLKEMGFDVTRLSYWQIWEDWENTKNALTRILRRRNYRHWPEPLWEEPSQAG
ncbi:DUF559 domain-containing protein [Trueperella pyogenes]